MRSEARRAEREQDRQRLSRHHRDEHGGVAESRARYHAGVEHVIAALAAPRAAQSLGGAREEGLRLEQRSICLNLTHAVAIALLEGIAPRFGLAFYPPAGYGSS